MGRLDQRRQVRVAGESCIILPRPDIVTPLPVDVLCENHHGPLRILLLHPSILHVLEVPDQNLGS